MTAATRLNIPFTLVVRRIRLIPLVIHGNLLETHLLWVPRTDGRRGEPCHAPKDRVARSQLETTLAVLGDDCRSPALSLRKCRIHTRQPKLATSQRREQGIVVIRNMQSLLSCLAA